MEKDRRHFRLFAKDASWRSCIAPALCLLGLALAPTPVPADQGQAKGQPAGDLPSHDVPAPTKGNAGSEEADAVERLYDDLWLLSGREEKQDILISLDTRESLRYMLRDFPDLSNANSLWIEHVGAEIASLPDTLLQRIAAEGKNLRSLRIDGSDRSRPNQRTQISDAGMEWLSRLSNLESLDLNCRVSADGFARLARLKKLKGLGIDGPTFGARPFFETVSKLPSIRSLMVRYADFSQPIDDETFKAVASLNGRLESLSFGEWAETTMHASLIPAIAEIKSLTWLDLGETAGSLPKPEAYYLRKLPYLEHLTGHDSKATAFHGLRKRENCPVQFRTVKSPAEMIVLLRFVLGHFETVKIRREVVRRRAGLSPRPPEGYPRSKYPFLVGIFKDSFDVKLTGSASDILPHITHGYPELDQQIRRYLAGEDFVEEEESKAEADE